MRDVNYIKKVRAKIKEKLGKIDEKLIELRKEEHYGKNKEYIKLCGLKMRYTDYVTALNFALNEDSKLYNFNSEYYKGLEEFIFNID